MKFILFFAASVAASLFISGCGSKTIQMEPTVKYGNPSHSHVKNLPQVKYKDGFKNKANPTVFELSSDEYEKLGDAFFLNKKYDMAVSQYETSLSQDPSNLRVRYKKGVGLLGLGSLNDAREQFEIIVKKDQNYALAYEGLGRVYLKKKQYALSKKYFNLAVKHDPLLWRSYGYLGNISHIQKQYEAAIQYYHTAITVNPDAGYLYNNLGFSYYSISAYEKAVNAYYKAIELNYAGSEVFNNLGRTLIKAREYDKAFKAYLNGGTEAVAYNNLGVGYLENGKIPEAVRCFKKAIELSPQFYQVANENLRKSRILLDKSDKEEKNDDS